MLVSVFRYNAGMKNAASRIVAALTVGIFAMLAVACQKSPEQVFAEVARSVVVVMALDSSGDTKAQGSGVVVGKNEVVTNCHVIDGAKSVVVRQAADSGGDETYRMDARVLARDDERDLCLLFVDELSEPPAAPMAAIGVAKGLSVGEEVFAVGAPKGLELSLSRGVVSQLRGLHGKRATPLVQTDAAISPGSSGGGLFNENAELVGITTFKWKGESLNFALPAEWVGELREKGREELAAAEKLRECGANPDYECVITVALSIARSIGKASFRTWALQDIASAQAKAGDTDGAFATARSIDDADDRVRALRNIASAQAEAGDMDGAFATARSIDGADDRAWTLRNIGLAQLKAGDIDGAFSTVRNIESVAERDILLNNIASAQAESGDIAAALSTAQKINEEYDRDKVFRDIAIAQTKSGRIAAALSTAQNMKIGTIGRIQTLNSVAVAQEKWGDKFGAKDTFAAALSDARKLDNSYLHARNSALGIIAVAQAKAGFIASAFSTVRGISADDILSRLSFLSDIVQIQAKAGDFNGALSTARNIDAAGNRAWALGTTAVIQAEAGDIAAALSLARSIGSAAHRAEALSAIAVVQVMEAGNKSGARDTFAAALSVARGIDDSWLRAQTLRDIASARAETGDITAALSDARSIGDAFYRARALQDIASEQAELGDSQSANDTLAAALSAVRSIEDAKHRVWVLRDIASKQVEEGNFRDAMKSAMEIEMDDERTHALANIAKNLAAREKK